MNRGRLLLSIVLMLVGTPAGAGQAPFAAGAQDFPVGGRDRVYAAEQFSNTVSVIDPSTNKNLGVIRLGDPQPMNLSPLYKGQVLVHGLGFSPDRKTLAVVSIASNSVTFVDTATNRVKHTTYVGRSPHEAFFTQDGSEVWVSVRGEDYIAVLDGATFAEKSRITVPNGPGMTIFSPDGRYGYVCSSFTPETVVVSTETHEIVGRVKQVSPFCPNIAASPDGDQVWLTLKDVGKVMVFAAKPPFQVLRVLDTGPITNHVNFVRTARPVRLCHDRRTQPGEGLSDRRFRASRDHSRRRPAAWDMAFRRRHARLCWNREWRCGDCNRYVHQPGCCHDPERTGGTSAGLRSGGCSHAICRNRELAAAWSRRRRNAFGACCARQRHLYNRFVVRPGAHASAAGRGRRSRAGQALHARAHVEPRRDRAD